MKVVFINLYEYSYLGTRCLASFLQTKGIETHNILMEDYTMHKVLDPEAKDFFGYHIYMNGMVLEQPLPPKNGELPFSEASLLALKEAIRAESPDIIAYSSRSTHDELAPNLAQIYRECAPDALLIAGGFGPTLNVDLYLGAGFDCVIRGDGEESLLEIANAYEKRDRLKLVNIANTCWNPAWGGEVNGLRDQVKDLSKYPAPLSGDSHFSYIKNGVLTRYRDPILLAKKYFTFFGRGCIGTCAYCSGGQWSSLYRKEGKKAYKRRNRNIMDVINELKNLPRNINFIVFADEYWGNNRKLSYDFFSKYRDEVQRPFFAYLDYDHILEDNELFELVVESGLEATGIGFQTGSSDLSKTYYRRKQNYERLVRYAWLMFKNKIHINPQFIGGNCYETMDDFLQTVELVRKLPYDIECPYVVQLQTTQLRAHPGSLLREIAPRVVTSPMPTKEWHYRAILLEMARILSKEEFDRLLTLDFYRQNPIELQKLYEKFLLKKQYAHFTSLIEKTRSQHWVYYGAGYTYNRNKEFFRRLNPEAIILDSQYIGEERDIDDISVRDIKEFFANGSPENTHIMIFSDSPWQLAKNLLHTYKVPFENIHSCASSWCSPFAGDRVKEIESYGDVEV